ncbi:MAG: hypothetical protein WB778_06590 [Thermoplasmata archaeon]
MAAHENPGDGDAPNAGVALDVPASNSATQRAAKADINPFIILDDLQSVNTNFVIASINTRFG